MSLVSDPEDLAAIATAVAASPIACFDIEFLSAERLVPVFALLQVSWLDAHVTLDAPAAEIVALAPQIALVDPLAVDVSGLVGVLAAHACCVAHGCRQDLGILASRFGAEMHGVVDTQVMAAFAGLGDQVGFGALVTELLGIPIDKGPQWTDWARRPLSPVQLAYAEADVRHLPALYALLAERIGPRLPWARAESAEIAEAALVASRITPETAWQDVGGVRGLDPDALGIVATLAAWRLRVARELDKPLGQLLNDRTIVEIARSRPPSPSAIRAVKGISPLARTRADEIFEALGASVAAPVAERSTATRAASPRAQRWAEILLLIAQLAADELGIAVRLIATRADVEDFARAIDERGPDGAADHRALTTWRRAAVGDTWLAWLRGEVGLVGDPSLRSGIALR